MAGEQACEARVSIHARHACVGVGRSKCNDLKIFSAGGISLWYCLLRAGVNADVAGVLAALCLSTKAT
eukprot:1094396-Pleurochrysis_carterae.AAC.1